MTPEEFLAILVTKPELREQYIYDAAHMDELDGDALYAAVIILERVLNGRADPAHALSVMQGIAEIGLLTTNPKGAPDDTP